MDRLCAAALAMVSALTLFSCKAQKKAPAPQNTSAPQTAPVEQTQAPPAAAGEAAQPAMTASPQTAPAPARIDTGIQSLLAQSRESTLLPEDFSIGPLGDQTGLEGKDKAAFTSARSFVNALTEGRVDRTLLAPDSSSQLETSLSYHLGKGLVPSSFRIGRPKELSSGEIAFNVRLFRQEGAAEGEIYLSETDKTWRVSDFQLNMAELAQPRIRKEEKFFPSSYRWLLGE